MRPSTLSTLALSLLTVAFLASCKSTSRTTAPLGAGLSQTIQEMANPLHPIDQAKRAWVTLSKSGLDEAQKDAALRDYHLAVDKVVRELMKEKDLREWTEWMSLETGSQERFAVRVELGKRDVKVWSPHLFDDLNKVKLSVDLKTDTLRWGGLGRIYVGKRKARWNDVNRDFLPPRGQHLPVTAILDFSAGLNATPVLKLVDPREVQTYKIGNQSYKVAADYLSAAHSSLRNRSALRVAFGGLVRPEKWLENQGLYMLEPYRSDKIPVIFVHGLFSEPHIWENHVRTLMADPVLGNKIQCWYYVYPTGIPIATSSANLRTALENVQSLQDPLHQHARPKQIMMVGHSMGGILSRLQVTDSGYTFWNAWFKRPPEEIPLESEVRRHTSKTLFFTPNDSVDRMVFIATPHRGSKMATSWIGTMASALIRLPLQTAEGVTSILSLDLDYVRFEVGKNKFFLFNSIGSLSPEHPMLMAMDQKSIAVPHHSIIGNRGLPGPIEKSSDGVVTYSSSHLKSAESELIVPYWHGCVEMPQTVEEVRRIAELHLNEAATSR